MKIIEKLDISPRFRVFIDAGVWTILLALPSGLMGWAAACAVDFICGLQSSKPLWFLPFWCLVFFCFAYMHFKEEEVNRQESKNFDERWREAERGLKIAA
ncbi:MAG: hypothetical protein HOC91_16155 [Nitrospinaceae bacterium]|nr:hypothetical protein [Nitrospinaceae bacterium]MBT3820575.1 hypothetical protein [Nitrospinaceae bacterium]MBT4093457.1 hypothetical protein [Nitrospinaceae bacterium]MBT4432043.1 hypothetical protein [Nitrospinaceae bacterium]MBT5369878.1 hypothetical protein [Nitrospinaceae bacterium]